MAAAVLMQYRTVLDLVGEQVVGVTDDELVRPTPCSEWDLGTLLGHTLGAMRYYAALARDGEVQVREVVVPVGPGDGVVALLAADASNGLAAWSAPGALDRTVTMVLGAMPGADALAIHVADLAVHTWDIARARGHGIELPDDVAETAIDRWQRVFAARDLRGIVFAEGVPVPHAASPTARLVSLCGREP